MQSQVKKEIDLNKIIQTMYRKYGKDGLTELEKARYLYIELGKLFRYDMNYLTYYDRKKEDIYFNQVDFDNIKDNAFTCVQMSQIYIEALRRVGVEAKLQDDIRNQIGYSMSHKYAVINLADGRQIIADLIYDLPYIQLGMKTDNFGTNSELGEKDVLTEDEIKAIDDKIGYTYKTSKYERVYTETFLEMIKQELNDPQMILEYINDASDDGKFKKENFVKYKLDLIKYFIGIQTMGFYEGSRILAKFYKDFFSEEERQMLRFALFRKEPYENHKIGNVEQIACYSLKKENEEYEYYIYEEGKSLESITKNDMKQKIKSFRRITKSNLEGFEDLEQEL